MSIEYPPNWDKCEAEYLEPEEEECEEGTECENCGTVTDSQTCSRACYNIMKAEYQADMERDEPELGSGEL